jgi:predicted secreted protein
MALPGLFLWGLIILSACTARDAGGSRISSPMQPVAITALENTSTHELPLGTPTLAGGAIVNLTEKNNGGSVALAVNDMLAIQLAGNPTTGFIWEADNLDANHFAQIGTYTYAADSKLMGAAGQFTLTFKVLSSGEGRLRLIYHRTFEKGVPPLKVFEVTVTIHD